MFLLELNKNLMWNYKETFETGEIWAALTFHLYFLNFENVSSYLGMQVNAS